MNHEALAQLFYRELLKAVSVPDLDDEARCERLYRLLNLLFTEVTRAERLQFSTLFARMAYAGHRYELSSALQFYLHAFRKGLADPARRRAALPAYLLPLGIKALGQAITALLGVNPPAELQLYIPREWPLPYRPAERAAFHHKVRVVALSDDAEQCTLLARTEDRPEETARIAYNLADHNENFNPTIDTLRSVFRFPVTLHLIDAEVDQEGVYRPRAIVVEPDFLLDVSAVAGCFREQAAEPWLFLLDKFKPFSVSKHRIIGNIANFFLDELMTDPEAEFKTVFAKVFRLSPLAFCLLPDAEVKEIHQSVQKHFVTLRTMVLRDFAARDIAPEHCFLEPSFYSETYGLQGRLDVFCYQPDDESKAAIVELKSGKPFNTNGYRINHDHFVQTLLYDLMIQSAFDRRLNTANYILYSSQDEDPLRFAPRIRSQQYDSLQVRNQMAAIERLLQRLGNQQDVDLAEQGRRLFGRISPGRLPALKGFARKDLEAFEAMYFGMTDLERRYFIAFAGFIAREHQLAKTGLIGTDTVNGLAALWLNTTQEKRDGFEILSGLKIARMMARDEEPILELERPATGDVLANFRLGDIAVLYPAQEKGGVLSNQIFKCTIIEISSQKVAVRLRSKQFNDSLFRRFEFWNIEHDLLDTSFVAMYRALYEFAGAPAHRKKLLLGIAAPRQAQPEDIPLSAELTSEQQHILRQAIAAPDYFLLWGPPGTGKTSMMLKHLVSYLLHHTDENILLLAYTNRAVDEMCEAVESIGPDVRRHYFRIGSRYATHPDFHPQLLDALIENVGTRRDLKALIDSRRIVLATVASIGGKPEILQLKSFARVIIDEASQILEPMLAGLLPRFERFILIGDHQQLPAVVGQSPDASRVEDSALQSIGLHNLRNSLFERLFRLCIQNNYTWAFAQLSRQGRMHRDIMAFPNSFFYQNTLQILPDDTPGALRQTANLPFDAQAARYGLESVVALRRVLFLSTPTDEGGAAQKTNRHEAVLIADLVGAFQRLYDGRPLSIGVITPYRAQIARIRAELESRQIQPDELTIDTVERYQGGARDVILISLCTNSLSALSSLISLSDDGVDRKLNVALTRAREHVVVVGNAELLRENETYAQFIAMYSV
ncbi:MAG TPA: AAA domain-containing protein [Saprospiraceae bacterium]|nr:AAA domain-containing protein [Saprospiraceae bacterium]